MPPTSTPCNRKLLHLITIQERQMNNLYNSSARKLSLVLSKHKIRSKSNIWLGNAAIKKEVDVVMASFAASMKSLISTNMASSWNLADECNDKLITDYLKKTKVPEDVKRNMLSRNAPAFNSFVNRKKAGLNLSQRVWNIQNGTKEQLELLMSSGITEGRAAARMAPDIRRYLKEPNKQFRRIRDKQTGKLKLSNPAKDYHPGRGVYRSSYRNALRLARNEVNMSYRHSDTLRREKLPFVTGITVHLSNSHPTYDICDELQGDYPKQFNFGGWHPNCICYTTAKLLPKKEFIEHLNASQKPGYRLQDTSRNVRTIPKNATKYLKNNAERFDRMGSTPYFLEDNFKLINGKYALNPTSGAIQKLAIETPRNVNTSIARMKSKGFDTEKMYSKNGVYTPERALLHDNIIKELMREVPHTSKRKNYMLGGGSGNGKSTLVNSGKLPHPKGILTVDSDAIKSLIPEYEAMIANGDTLGAGLVHEESSMLSKRLIRTTQKFKHDFVLDGVNDGTIDKLMKKIKGYKSTGSTLRADYCSLDTDLSLKLAKNRAKKTGRTVPRKVVLDSNREVSNLVPELIKRNAVDELYLWDTNIEGNARLILKQINGKLTIYDQKLYDKFLAKANYIDKTIK